MKSYQFIDDKGTFELEGADKWSYAYFPVASESGMMGAVTPELGGDLKTSQNTFILEPVSSDNLHNNKSTRNFWINIDGKLYSAMGASAIQHAAKLNGSGLKADEVKMTAGLLYQKMTRSIADTGVTSEVTTFVPVGTSDKVEITTVDIINNSGKDITITPTTAVPIYGRSADNIRDHRNVTSMLNRMSVTKYGVVNNPTLTFDERGHRRNVVTYGVFTADITDAVAAPKAFCPLAEDFIGEGGAFDAPAFPLTGEPASATGARADGFEAIGAGIFDNKTIKAGQKASYVIVMAIAEISKPSDTEEEISKAASDIEAMAVKYLDAATVKAEFEKMTAYWQKKNNVKFRSGDKAFDNWMYWVGVQPMLRRIYGCSFLPHHDYGKGGRGWRDLWQDCLALIVMDPSDVRDMLIENFGGVRTDGTNATIIGSGRGEFIADRNGITRVWMDHAMWPYMTMELYIKQSGDFSILDKKAPYFIDRQVMRGEKLLSKDDYTDEDIAKFTSEGTVIEHLILQNLASFFDVGEHGHMKLRGADWNDALDMGKDRGESVAFTAAYAGNLKRLASLIESYAAKNGISTIDLPEEFKTLMNSESDYTKFGAILASYCDAVKEGFKLNKVAVAVADIVADLNFKAEWITKHVRETEWFTDGEGYSRYNGYYDNNGRPLETGDAGNMMLTSEVFTIMSGIASDDQVAEICKSADKYIYDEAIGGYKLNTNFHEIKTDMGRMFGFSYGQKENGAVFSHMTTMYGNALYSRGFKEEGWKVIGSLYRHAADFPSAKIYPGVPEYFDPKGRGVYHYLTGAASWLMLTVLTEMFGVKGEYGALKFEPQLVDSQFDNGEAGVSFEFNGKPVDVTYKQTAAGASSVGSITVDGVKVVEGSNVLPADKIGSVIVVELV